MVVRTDPGCRSDHRHPDHDQRDNTPGQDDRGSMLGEPVLEGADDEEEEPSNSTGGATRVDTTNVLDEAGKEDAPPEGSPLHIGISMLL